MEYIGPFFYGLGMGFLMSVLLGVIFFMLIQVGIKHDWKKGFSIAAGVITGDIIFVILAIGFTGFFTRFLKSHDLAISLFGGAFLIVMAILAIFKGRGNINISSNQSRLKRAQDFYLKPFIINILNPANAAWWLALYSLPPVLHYALNQKIIFASGAISAIFFTEVGIAAGASKLKKYVTPDFLKIVDVVVAVVLLIFGTRLILKGLEIIAF